MVRGKIARKFNISSSNPTRVKGCDRCGNVEPTWDRGWFVPDDEWLRIVPEKWQNKTLCPWCFVELAREKDEEYEVFLNHEGSAQGVIWITPEFRNYRFDLRDIAPSGIVSFKARGKDVSEASNNLADWLGVDPLDITSTLDAAYVWNPIEKEWVPHRPWWEEEKEPYEWEK